MAVTGSRFSTDATGQVWNLTMVLAVRPGRRGALADAIAPLDADSPFAGAPPWSSSR